MIKCLNLTKQFISYRKEPGLKGSLKSFIHRKPIIKKAVNNFSLKINPGECVGLLGPNGAGKTTLMKMMTGIIVPSSGELTVLGNSPHQRKKDFRQKIALVMGQKSQLWWDIPAMDSLILLQKYYDLDKRDFYARVEELSELLHVKDVLHVHVRKLSLGERMKLELMSSLLHQPEVIFLDEPTIGLDIIAQENIRKFLMRYQKEHPCTIILTSHYMADIEAICDRIILVMDGEKTFDDSIQKFQNIFGKEKSVTFHFSEPVDTTDPLWQTIYSHWSHKNKQVDLRINESELKPISQEVLKRFPVSDFSSEKMSIEEVMNSILTNPQILRDY